MSRYPKPEYLVGLRESLLAEIEYLERELESDDSDTLREEWITRFEVYKVKRCKWIRAELADYESETDCDEEWLSKAREILLKAEEEAFDDLMVREFILEEK